MKFSSSSAAAASATLCLLLLNISVIFAYENARWEDVMVDPDRVQYKMGANVVDSKAKGPCTYNTKLPVTGTGTIGGTSLEFYCLKTGVVEGTSTPWAITCGKPAGGSKTAATVCMGFQGRTASGLEACTSLGLTDLQCAAKNVCDLFPTNIDVFSTNTQVTGTGNYLRITPKTLIVGQATSSQWIDIAAEELCWYHESIWKCINSVDVWNQGEFTDCTAPMFKKYVSNLWLHPTDSLNIMNTVKACNIFNPNFYKRIKEQEKKKKRKAIKLERAAKRRQQRKRNTKKARKRKKKEAEIAARKDNETKARKAEKKAAKTAERKRQKKCWAETNSTCEPVSGAPSMAPSELV